MDLKYFLVCFCLCCSFALCEDSLDSVTNDTTNAPTDILDTEMHSIPRYIDIESYRKRLDNKTDAFEKALKNFIKGTVKSLLPNLMKYNTDNSISTKCTSSLFKYISGLTSVKVWAIRSKCREFNINLYR